MQYYHIEDNVQSAGNIQKVVVRGKVSKCLRPVNVVNYLKLTVPFTDRGGVYPTQK